MALIKMTKAKAWVATVANAAAILVAFVAPDTPIWKVLTAIILLAGAIGVYQVPNKPTGTSTTAGAANRVD